jgi:hypothetical protein
VEIYVSPRNGRLEDGMVEAFRDLGVDQVIAPIFSRDADGLRKRADALAEQTLQRL